MNRDRFLYIASESEEGRDAFVRHPSSQEEGRVLSCDKTHIEVETSEGKKRCWQYGECEEIYRDAREWPRR